MAGSSSQTPDAEIGTHLLLYDGVCGLCNRVNTFVLRRDPGGVFAFASLQSPTGKTLLRRLGKPTEDLTTFYVVTNYRSPSPAVLAKSRAALFVLQTLGGVWRWIAMVGVLPTAVLDIGYDTIARHRYRLFGQYDTCMLPAPEHQQRFIDV
jgi:predicted DCC family thiol-disulfide oxidoreductase YuxK